MYSVLIPTTGTELALQFLKLSVKSLENNSFYKDYKIMVWSNGIYDPMREYCLENSRIRFFESFENHGLSYPYTVMVDAMENDLLYLADDDYYYLPGWDHIFDEINEPGDVRTSMRIEPGAGDKKRGINGNYGRTPRSFNEMELLKDYTNRVYSHRHISNFLPYAMRRDDYKKIDGHLKDHFTSEMIFLYKTYLYCTELLGKRILTCPYSFIYHFLHGTPRPNFYEQYRLKQIKYFEETFGFPNEELDTKLRMFEVVGPSLNSDNKLIDYGKVNI